MSDKKHDSRMIVQYLAGKHYMWQDMVNCACTDPRVLDDSSVLHFFSKGSHRAHVRGRKAPA